MLNRISLRWRLIIYTSFLIMTCCIGLSFVLNLSANRMANTIDANVILPAMSPDEQLPALTMMPSIVSKAKTNYLIESIGYTFFAVVLGGFLTYFVSKKVLEPVQILNEKVKKIEINHLSQTLEVPPTNDELSELTQSFNEMIKKLDDAFSMQKRFSADAAHELRTPLTIVQTKIDVFKKKQSHTSEEYDKLVITLEKQIKRLRKVLTQLLNFANLENELDLNEIWLDEVLEEIVNELSVLADKKQLKLTLKTEHLQIVADESLLYQAIYNVIENAIKYNVQNGNINICLNKLDNEKIKITIKDTGIGIPQNMKNHIFEPFYRVDKSRSREMGGNGLGLSLVKNIVDKHNGLITVEDNNPKGTIFTMMLSRNPNK